MENCQNFSKILWGWAVNGIDCSLRVPLYDGVEVVDFVNFGQPVVNFKACLERSSNRSNFSDFPSIVGIVVVTDLEIRRILQVNFSELFFLPTAEGPTVFGLLRSSQGCFHCEILVDLQSRCSSARLKTFQGSSGSFLLELLSLCCSHFLGQIFV